MTNDALDLDEAARVTQLVVTHDVELARGAADSVLVLEEGRIRDG